MRYNKYTYGDPYSEYHRQWAGLAMIDIDQVEICKNCKRPLFLIEAGKDTGEYYRDYRVTQWIAIQCKIPAFLLFWKKEKGKISLFKIRKIAPTETKELTILTPNEWLEFHFSMHRKHKCAPVI